MLVISSDHFWGIQDEQGCLHLACFDIDCPEVVNAIGDDGNHYEIDTEEYARRTETIAVSDIKLPIKQICQIK